MYQVHESQIQSTKSYGVPNPITNKMQIARDVCIVAEKEVHDCSNHQDEEFSGSKIVVVEDSTPSLNLTPQVSTFIPPIASNVFNNDNIIAHSDKSITTQKTPQWFQKLLTKRDKYLEWVDLNLEKLNTAMSSLMHSNNSQPSSKTKFHYPQYVIIMILSFDSTLLQIILSF